MSDLTKTQAKRLAARIQGDSLATIASAEGCTKQAIAKSLAAPAVHCAAFTILGRYLTGRDKDTGEEINIVCEALQTVAEVMKNAKRPVVLTQSIGGATQQYIEHVPDYPTRLAAAARLLSLVDKPTLKVAVEQEREMVTTHTRERLRVDVG